MNDTYLGLTYFAWFFIFLFSAYAIIIPMVFGIHLSGAVRFTLLALFLLSAFVVVRIYRKIMDERREINITGGVK